MNYTVYHKGTSIPIMKCDTKELAISWVEDQIAEARAFGERFVKPFVIYYSRTGEEVWKS